MPHKSDPEVLSDQKKASIDALSVYELLRAHRCAPSGDRRFIGAEGVYRCQRLADLQRKDPEAYLSASRCIGWGRDAA